MRSFLLSHRALRRIAPALLLGLVASLGHAQSADENPAAGDPPDRVARLSYLAGDVGFLPAGADDWSDAGVNRPLTGGDRLTTGRDGRVELELDRASLRADRDTDLGVLQLDDQRGQLELTRGTLNLSVRGLEAGQSYEIDTPTVALVVDRPGVFRINVDERNGSTEIVAIDGQATVYGENDASRLLVGGHSYRFDDSSLARVGESYSGARDAFDLWCADRDDRYARSQTRQYVSEDVVGYEDLDHYGQWQSSDDYGQVWYPATVTGDWAPYREGHWAYVAPWGWTWVDDAPWGFAPYHYGRWVSVRGRWGWIPGPRHLRAVYAPALVAFVGGSGWNVSIGSDAPIGWFPLGPGDIYNPWYASSAGYYRRVNRHNIRWGRDHRGDGDRRIDEHYRHHRGGHDPDQHYANRYAPHGITAMSGEAFVHARRADANRLKLDPKRLREAPVLARGNGLLPVRASVGGARGAAARPVPRGRFDRSVFAHRAPDRLAAHGGADRATTVRTPARGPSRVPGHAPGAGDAARFPLARGSDRIAPPVRDARTDAVRSARFAHPDTAASDQTGATFRGSRMTRPGTLPAVPRFVRPTQTAAVPRASAPTYRPRENARPATLPTPARIESAPRTMAERWRTHDSQPRVMHAPATRPAAEPVRRYDARGDARRETYTRSMPMQAPRSFAPAPRQPAPMQAPQRREAPAARRFAPAPQPSAPRQAPPARRVQGDDSNTALPMHFKHR